MERRCLGLALILASALTLPARAQGRGDCRAMDSAAAVVAIRHRLADWVEQTNRGDVAANEIWAAPVAGWFPRGAEFSDSAALAVAGVPPTARPATFTYEVQVEEVAVGGRLAAVHDIWKETRGFPESRVRVRREIRGSELWRCQADGAWRIVRWVSAPEHWVRLPEG